ncbi:hypothetical protein PYCCODRAFT_151023 [Trametes coccinea BRFM310]|uniref:Uncharacterized protein n=1 Tax=Trametes coccinea (strain BRFM310) TaxID=1353009 RepID=A0A1Y2IUP2_TRAC3|nr:hypothetical protein PYCCODRAFT_151023 [Trametes coccinea BRFM310]
MRCVHDLAVACCQCRLSILLQFESPHHGREPASSPLRQPCPDVSRASRLRGVWDDRKAVNVVFSLRTCLVRTTAIWHALKEASLDFGPSFVAARCSASRRGPSSAPPPTAADSISRRCTGNLCVRRCSDGIITKSRRSDVIGISCLDPSSHCMQHLNVTQDDLFIFKTHIRAFRTITGWSEAIREVAIRREYLMFQTLWLRVGASTGSCYCREEAVAAVAFNWLPGWPRII